MGKDIDTIEAKSILAFGVEAILIIIYNPMLKRLISSLTQVKSSLLYGPDC